MVFDFHGIMHNGHLLLIQNAEEVLIAHGYKNPAILIHPSSKWSNIRFIYLYILCKQLIYAATSEIPLPIMIAQYRASINSIKVDTTKNVTIVLLVFPERIMEWKSHSFENYVRVHCLLGVRFYAMVVEEFDHLICSKVKSPINTFNIMDLGRVTYDLEAQQMRSYASESFDRQQIFTNDQIQCMARSDQSPPEGFMANEAWEILRDYYQKNMTNNWK